LANQCSLHSCSASNDLCQRTAIENPGYTSSPSTDTLWDSKNEQSCNRQIFKPRPSSVYHPSASSSTHSYIQHRYVYPSQVQSMQNTTASTTQYAPTSQYSHRPKSWDNLAKGNACNYAVGAISNNGYMKYQSAVANDKSAMQHTSHVLVPRKGSQIPPYGRYSAFAEVENYVPAPQAFVQAETITKTTIITTTKSTENLINNAQYQSGESCECLVSASPQQQQEHCSPKPILPSNCAACNAAANFPSNQSFPGYYSNLTRNNPTRYIPTKTEITRL
jgi:hypothetical protein